MRKCFLAFRRTLPQLMTQLFKSRPLTLVFLAGVLSGIPFRAADADAAFKPAPLLTQQQVSFKVLGNGVRTVVKNTPGNDMVSIQVWVKAGSRYESASEGGLGHLVEICAARSSQSYPNRDGNSGPTEALQAYGGTLGSLTSRDSTFYSAMVAAPFAENAMKILADSVLRPDFSAANVEEAKLQIQDELTRRNIDGVNLATDLAYAVSFEKHPYRKPAYGTLIGTASLNSSRARTYFHRQYVGGNISVVVVGDIPVVRAQELIGKYFAAASSNKPAAVAPSAEAPLKLKVISRRARVAREAVVLAWRSPGIKDATDVVAMDALLSLWREGLDANLRRKLMRDGEAGPNKPLVGSFDVDFLTQKDAGLFIISLADVQDKEAAVNMVLDEVKRVGEEGVTEDELKRAKNLLQRQYVAQGENPAGQAGALGFYEMIWDYRFAVNYLAQCSAIKASDMKRAASTYLSPANYVRAEIDAIPMPRPDQEDPNPNVITTSLEVSR